MLYTKEMIALMGYKSAAEFVDDYCKKHNNCFFAFNLDGSVNAGFDYDTEPGIENLGYIDEVPDVDMPDPDSIDPSFLINFVRENSSYDADLLKRIIEEWRVFKRTNGKVVFCMECKHYHEGTAYCDLNSYFVDSDGLCCSPAESPNWTMFDQLDYCSRGERREDDVKGKETD